MTLGLGIFTGGIFDTMSSDGIDALIRPDCQLKRSLYAFTGARELKIMEMKKRPKN